jgi:hypothetical protein
MKKTRQKKKKKRQKKNDKKKNETKKKNDKKKHEMALNFVFKFVTPFYGPPMFTKNTFTGLVVCSNVVLLKFSFEFLYRSFLEKSFIKKVIEGKYCIKKAVLIRTLILAIFLI